MGHYVVKFQATGMPVEFSSNKDSQNKYTYLIRTLPVAPATYIEKCIQNYL